MSGVEVARVLREARDLMNTNGRHWIKGEMSVLVDEYILETGAYEGHISPKAKVGDMLFCTWGGIREAAGSPELQIQAMEALVEIIDPWGWNSYLAEMEEMEVYYVDISEYDKVFLSIYPTFDHYWDDRIAEREDRLGDIIATWNDDDKRTWDDVRTSLTKAAEKAKRAK